MQQVAFLDRAGRGGGEQPGRGDFSRLTAVAEADLAPLNGRPDSALRNIVRGFDAVMVDKGEQALYVKEEESCQCTYSGVLAVEVSPAQRKELFLDRHRLANKLVPVDRAAAIVVPKSKQPGMKSQSVPCEAVRVGSLAQLLDAQEVSLQVRPAELSDSLVVLDVGAEAVTAQDAGKHRPQNLLKDLRATAFRDYEEGEGSRHQHPKPAFLPVLAPARLVPVEDRFMRKPLFEFFTRGLQGLAGFLDVPLRAAESDRSAQSAFEQLFDFSPGMRQNTVK